MIPWLIGLGLLTCCALLLYRMRRKRAVIPGAEDDLLVFLSDWLSDPHVTQAAYQAGVLTPQTQARLLLGLGQIPMRTRAGLMYRLLSPRPVRRAVAMRMQKTLHLSRAEAMSKLGIIVENMRLLEKGLVG